MRKLASIKVVSTIIPIDGKDKIALGIVDGWQVIINKEQIKVGDKIVYCEIDSVMPPKPEFEFLKSKNYRIKTMKMAGVVSQGICFPMDVLPDGSYEIDDDVTEILGVKQYDETMDNDREVDINTPSDRKYPQFLMKLKWFRKLVLPKKQIKGFPSFISKTDKTRIQNAPFYLQDKTPFVATEKVDGQSGSFCLVRHKSKIPFVKDKFEYIVCSRNLRLWKKDNSSYWSVSDRYDMENVLKELIGNKSWVAIQGECVASNVQGNKYKVDKPDFFAFNLIYPDGRMGSLDAAEILHEYGVQFVPILDANYILPNTVNEILEYAHGESKLYPTLREGVVFRSKDGKRSFKAVDPIFLLKHDE